MIVAVGSQNPIKINAVKNVFNKFFPNAAIVGIDVKTGLSKQPIGLSTIIRGAQMRSYLSLSNVKHAYYGVGIEAGLVKCSESSSGYLNIQVCVIKDINGYSSIGVSAGYELPKPIVDKIINNPSIELEDIMEELTGIDKIGEKMGAIYILSKGVMSRLHLSEQAVLTALLPFINKELYWRG